MSIPDFRKAEPPGLVRSILSFDPSTDVVGLSLVSFCEGDSPHLRHVEAFDATVLEKAMTKEKRQRGDERMTSLERRIWRIREIRTWATQAVYRASLVTGWDTVAIEWPNARGAAAVSALHETIGVLLTLNWLASMRIVPVHAATAKGVWATEQEDHFRPTGSKAEDFSEKSRMVDWAMTVFDAEHGHFGHHACIETPKYLEAMADALGVAVAANVILQSPPANKKKRTKKQGQ